MIWIAIYLVIMAAIWLFVYAAGFLDSADSRRIPPARNLKYNGSMRTYTAADAAQIFGRLTQNAIEDVLLAIDFNAEPHQISMYEQRANQFARIAAHFADDAINNRPHVFTQQQINIIHNGILFESRRNNPKRS